MPMMIFTFISCSDTLLVRCRVSKHDNATKEEVTLLGVLNVPLDVIGVSGHPTVLKDSAIGMITQASNPVL